MANDSNDKNFKNKLTKELKEKIQKSVRDSFEKNIEGKGGTENAKIRDFERRVVDAANIRRVGDVEENRKIKDFERGVLDRRKKILEKKDTAQNKLRDAKTRLESPAARQEEVRKIKENIKRNIKEKSRKIKERTKESFEKRKAALRSKLKERAKKKLTMDAQKGKSGCITILFIVALLLALLNDSLDIIATIAAWVIGLIAVGVGIAATAPAIEVILDVVDIVTTFLLVVFSLYVGGKTKAGAAKKIKPLGRCLGGAVIEMIPVVNLVCSWVIVVLLNWREARKRATEAEKNAAEINQLRG